MAAEATPTVIAPGNVAVITGGASGIGLAVAERLIARGGVEGGIDASVVADRVETAVDAGKFWILTHDDIVQLPVERMQRAASGTNPPAFGQD